MKKGLILIFGITLSFFLACEKNGDDPTCTDGIQNGNETGIDCGGDCEECFDCTTNFCSLLSGATSTEPRSTIKWTSVLLNGSPDDGTEKFTFYSKGKVVETYGGESATGRWKFDDPDSPTEININHTDPPSNWDNPVDMTLLHLDADTLKLQAFNQIFSFIKE